MTKPKTALDRTINRKIKDRLPELIIFPFVGIPMSFSVWLYYLNYIKGYTENPQYDFGMATLSATIGGFLLVGGIFRKIQSELIDSARAFLASALFSTIFTFTLPMLAIAKPENVFAYCLLIIIVTVSGVVTTLGFSWGVSVLIPCLWKIGKGLD